MRREQQSITELHQEIGIPPYDYLGEGTEEAVEVPEVVRLEAAALTAKMTLLDMQIEKGNPSPRGEILLRPKEFPLAESAEFPTTTRQVFLKLTGEQWVADLCEFHEGRWVSVGEAYTYNKTIGVDDGYETTQDYQGFLDQVSRFTNEFLAQIPEDQRSQITGLGVSLGFPHDSARNGERHVGAFLDVSGTKGFRFVGAEDNDFIEDLIRESNLREIPAFVGTPEKRTATTVAANDTVVLRFEELTIDQRIERVRQNLTNAKMFQMLENFENLLREFGPSILTVLPLWMIYGSGMNFCKEVRGKLVNQEAGFAPIFMDDPISKRLVALANEQGDTPLRRLIHTNEQGVLMHKGEDMLSGKYILPSLAALISIYEERGLVPDGTTQVIIDYINRETDGNNPKFIDGLLSYEGQQLPDDAPEPYPLGYEEFLQLLLIKQNDLVGGEHLPDVPAFDPETLEEATFNVIREACQFIMQRAATATAVSVVAGLQSIGFEEILGESVDRGGGSVVLLPVTGSFFWKATIGMGGEQDRRHPVRLGERVCGVVGNMLGITVFPHEIDERNATMWMSAGGGARETRLQAAA